MGVGEVYMIMEFLYLLLCRGIQFIVLFEWSAKDSTLESITKKIRKIKMNCTKLNEIIMAYIWE